MPFYRQLALSSIVAATMMAAALVGCGNAVPDQHVVSAKSAISATSRSPLVHQSGARAPATNFAQRGVPLSAEVGSSFDGVNQHADPQRRMAMLEVWAAAPRESLDPVTYALVDPDEAVRTRAQELLEQGFARR